jgi:predicted Zn finger-like uncharacterized protein
MGSSLRLEPCGERGASMIVVCPSCQARYKFDEAKLGERPKVKTRCAKCGGAIEIENPLVGNATLPPGSMAPPAPEPQAPAPPPPTPPAREKPTQKTQVVAAMPEIGSQTITGRDLHKMGILELPKDKRYSLAVIQGAATGQIFQVSKSRTTLGRSGCDIDLDDPEASRQHAVIEIFGERAILRDVGSTNGTFVDLERVEQQVLTNQMEFRIGSHVLMLIVTDVE